MKDLYVDGKLVIGIDHGYGNMKTRNSVFKSGVKSYSEEPAVATNVLQLDGIYYVIGESHKVFIANKDEDNDYYILTLAAIAKDGGGGCLIRNFGKYNEASVEIIDDICATAKGYEELYMAQYLRGKGA